MSTLGRRAYMQVAFWVWFGAVAVVSLLPGDVMESTRVIVTTSGFWEHVLGYGVLGLLAALAFAGRWVWLVLVVVLAVSVGFEVAQVLFLERTFNWMDVGANGIGLALGMGLGKIFLLRGKF